jgi:hypothetical protein
LPGAGKDTCPFGGSPQSYALGQHFAFASSDNPDLQDGGSQCLGAAKSDPVSATFDEVYSSGGKFHYVIWNDQPHGDPSIAGCSSGADCSAPWAHSKGVLAWNDDGEGFVMQVSTPSWPISGNPKTPRPSGNSLGCYHGADNVELSQHFFALALTEPDVETVLSGLANAGVATNKSEGSMMLSNGGPEAIQTLVKSLGTEPSKDAQKVMTSTLSSGVVFLSKSSGMDVPPWQFVSAELGGANLRVATFYDAPHVVTTTQAGVPGCWNATLPTPGAVDNAESGSWTDPATSKKVALSFSSASSNGNHAKIGVTTSGTPMAIFGDENQQGSLAGNCTSSQNGRGGTFYALPDAQLTTSLTKMLAGTSY